MARLATAFLLLCVACSSKPERSGSTAPGSTAAGGDATGPTAGGSGSSRCATALPELRAYGEKLVADPASVATLQVDVPLEVELVPLPVGVGHDDGLDDAMGPVLVVQPERTTVAGEAGEPRELLAKWRGATEHVTLVADRRASWERVAAAGRATLERGVHALLVSFDLGKSPATPPPSSVDAFYLSRPRQGGAALMQEKVFPRCPAAPRRYLAAGKPTTEEALEKRNRELFAGFEECGCDFEVAAVERWFWFTSLRDPVGRRFVRVTLHLAAEGDELAVPPGSTWEQAAPIVLAAASAAKTVRM